MKLPFLLTFFAVVSTAFAGYDFAVVGDVHHVEATQNKILIVVSGPCRSVNSKADGWIESIMDHGIIVIARKDRPHAPDQDSWDALTTQARSVVGKKASIACIDPDSITIERREVFMVRCRLQSYPAQKSMSTTVWISEGNQYP